MTSSPSTILKTLASRSAVDLWSPGHSETLYRDREWSNGYFGVSDRGTVFACPGTPPSPTIDLFDLVEGLRSRDLATPILLRFPGITAHRMEMLRAEPW